MSCVLGVFALDAARFGEPLRRPSTLGTRGAENGDIHDEGDGRTGNGGKRT